MKNKILKIILIITILLIIFDQITKIIAKFNIHESREIGFFEISLIENQGIAFGMNNGNTQNIVLTLVILGMIINFIIKQKEQIDLKTALALSLILSGGISNLLDRIIHGGVVDFIGIKNFAIFNMADCYIVVGWILMIIFVIKFSKGILGVKNCEK